MEDLESDLEEDQEFKSKNPIAEGPKIFDRNLCRPYNFRVSKKYADNPSCSKTVLNLEKHSDSE